MKMEILDKLSVKMFVFAGVLEMLSTLLLGYGLYEITGHAFNATTGHGLIPVISDCGVHAIPREVCFSGWLRDRGASHGGAMCCNQLPGQGAYRKAFFGGGTGARLWYCGRGSGQ